VSQSAASSRRVVQPLREAIPNAIARAVEVRGCYDVAFEHHPALSVSLIAAVDGSLEVVTSDRGRRKGLLRRSHVSLDPDEMTAIGFQHARQEVWRLIVPAGPGAKERAKDAIERLFTGPFECSLDADVRVWFDYPGCVPDAPAPPADAPHVEHVAAAMAIFEIDPRAHVLVSAGLPGTLCLHFALVDDDRVKVQVGGHDGATPPPIAGYTESPDVEGALSAVLDRETFPATADALLHEHLGVGDAEPLFIALRSDVVSPREHPRA
jgi:hypothetical protein